MSGLPHSTRDMQGQVARVGKVRSRDRRVLYGALSAVALFSMCFLLWTMFSQQPPEIHASHPAPVTPPTPKFCLCHLRCPDCAVFTQKGCCRPLLGAYSQHANSHKDVHKYQGEDFTCVGRKGEVLRLPLNRINDDYCDCPDGTDEPGTAACPNSKFWCKADQKYIEAAMVDDGICDCCLDGSDEAGETCVRTRCEAEAVPAQTAPPHPNRHSPHPKRHPNEKQDMTPLVVEIIFAVVLLHLLGIGALVYYYRLSTARRERTD